MSPLGIAMTLNNGLKLRRALMLGLLACLENFRQASVIFQAIGQAYRQRAARRYLLRLFLLEERKLKKIYVTRWLVRLLKLQSARCRLPSCAILSARFWQTLTKKLQMLTQREPWLLRMLMRGINFQQPRTGCFSFRVISWLWRNQWSPKRS